MTYLYVDLETTGLPTGPYNDLNQYDNCRIVSVALILVDGSKAGLPDFWKKTFMIKPDDFCVPDGMVHGISHEMAEADGVDFVKAFTKLFSILKYSNTFVAYNVDFDYNVLRAEFRRRNMREHFTWLGSLKQMCVMKTALVELGLPGYLRLQELYDFLIPDNPGFKAHDAMEDIWITLLCHRKIREIMFLKPKKEVPENVLVEYI